MYLVATLLTYLVFVFVLPVLLLHPKIREGFWERSGRYPPGWPPERPGPRIWVHGASAGDVLALMPTVREIRAQRADAQIFVSTITNSGRAMANREASVFSATTYLPYDLPGSVSRALSRIRPDTLVLEYTELWPQLIRAAHRRKIRLVLHNGRLSARRVPRYQQLFFWFGNLLQRFDLLLMRDRQEADTALQLGADPDRIHITGNTKFDNLRATPPTEQVAALRAASGFPPHALVWVAGSTHEGEEEQLLDVFLALRQDLPQLRMVIAPRYVERAERILGWCQNRRLVARIRSSPGPTPDVLILDTIGELAACYALSTIVFVGGSFIPRGGQNILEPAICGRPVLFGPYMDNFADSVQVLLGRGGIQVADAKQLAKVLQDLLHDPEHIKELGEMAATQVAQVRGAAARNAELILRGP